MEPAPHPVYLNSQFSRVLIPLTMLFGLLSAVGAVGNILVLTVFLVSKEYKDTNFKTFVVSFGVVDLVTCLLFLPLEVAKNHAWEFWASQWPCKAKCFFNISGMTFSALLLLLISVERYRKVCQPLKEQIWPSLSLRLVALVVALTLILSIPSPVLCGVTEARRQAYVNDTHTTTKTLLLCKTDDRFADSVWRLLYKAFLVACLLAVSVSVIVMYVRIGLVIVRQGRSRRPSLKLEGEAGERLRHSQPAELTSTEQDIPCNEMAGDKDCNDAEQQGEQVQNSDRKRKVGVVYSGNSLRKQVILKNAWTRSASVTGRSARGFRRLSSYSGPGGLPYKTLIWLVLTIIFIVTYALYAGLSFWEPSTDPNWYLLYNLLLRLYFVNSIANPVVYACLDKRFRRSCARLVSQTKNKVTSCCRRESL